MKIQKNGQLHCKFFKNLMNGIWVMKQLPSVGNIAGERGIGCPLQGVGKMRTRDHELDFWEIRRDFVQQETRGLNIGTMAKIPDKQYFNGTFC